jgi:hypothetical protein
MVSHSLLRLTPINAQVGVMPAPKTVDVGDVIQELKWVGDLDQPLHDWLKTSLDGQAPGE